MTLELCPTVLEHGVAADWTIVFPHAPSLPAIAAPRMEDEDVDDDDFSWDDDDEEYADEDEEFTEDEELDDFEDEDGDLLDDDDEDDDEL